MTRHGDDGAETEYGLATDTVSDDFSLEMQFDHERSKRDQFRLRKVLCWLAVWGLLSGARSVYAQSTGFTYQGQLNSAKTPANGTFDLRFTLYDSLTNSGGLVAGPVTNFSVPVSNGLFVTTLDFGAEVFTGADRWLEIGVSPSSTTNFTTLAPRQKLAPTPYALFANSASNLSSTLNFSSLSTSAQTTITNIAQEAVAPTNLVVFCDGDSQTAPQPDGTDWPTVLQSLSFCSNRIVYFTNIGVNSTGIADATNRYATLVAPHKPVAGQKGYYLLYIGVNDLHSGYTVQSWSQIYSNLCVQARTDGFKVIAMTFPRDAEPLHHSGYPGTVNDLFSISLNTWLRGATNVWDVLIDLERALPNPYDTQFFNPDHLHLNQAGRALVASFANNALVADAQTAVSGTPYWQQLMPLARAPWITSNLVSAASPGQDWSTTSPFLVDGLRYKSNSSAWTSIGWAVPFGFTNLTATITLAPTNSAVPVTLGVNMTCDVPASASRTTTQYGPITLTGDTNFQISCTFTTNGGVRQAMLYLLNSTFTGPVTNGFYIKQVMLTGY